jgi:bifunctional non-homologous end joining protein LigD
MLETYSRKRNFKSTPEPSAKIPKKGQGDLIFVVQKHQASHLHYDFRLECKGVLLSWAVPKGPSYKVADKRLAMMVEDHPYDYKDFEGIIPSGYGAGQVIVWDKGTYVPVDKDGNRATSRKKAEEIVTEGVKAGKLVIVMAGERLVGEWTLVKLKKPKAKNEWLLIKHTDEYASDEDITEEDTSVVSGLTLQDLADGVKDGTGKSKRVARSTSKSAPSKNGKKSSLDSGASIKPMLATIAKESFSRSGWIYEPKLDGVRAIAYISRGRVKMFSRNALDLTAKYPPVRASLEKQSGDLVLDGEVVALDKNGRPSFQLLQNIASHPKSAEKIPIVYYVFDLLQYNGKVLTEEPVTKRKAKLESVLKESASVRYLKDLQCDGEEAYALCVKQGLEGIVAKKADSKYEIGRRSPNWLKVKSHSSEEFNVCGFTSGTGGRAKTFGALVLGYYDKNGKLVYAGRVGTGFDASMLSTLMKAMRPLISEKSPFQEKINLGSAVTWLKPNLVAEVKFMEWTSDKLLRAPVFLRLREDIEPEKTGASVSQPTPTKKTAKSATKEKTAPAAKGKVMLDQIESGKESGKIEVDGHTIQYSNLNKVLWPGTKKFPKATKRDYVNYLASACPEILAHLKDRPLTLKRYPNGVEGQSFFQKHWEHELPEFVESVEYFSEHNNKDGQFILCNNRATLLWLAQIADLELHAVHSRIDKEPDAKHLTGKLTGSVQNVESSILNYPDYLVIDLDPYVYSATQSKELEPELTKQGFAKASEVALTLKEMLDHLEIEAFVKTSGRTGLHIYVPIKRKVDYDTVRDIAHKIGEFLQKGSPDDITLDWAVKKRTGKIFFDYNMNARGKTLASAYSPRASLEATVSAPLAWEELGHVYPTDFTIFTMPARIKKVGDLWADILSHKNDLSAKFNKK